MSSEELSESEDINDRLKKKLKVDTTVVHIDPIVDITDMALTRYEDIKHQFNFVSFDESTKAK